MTAYRTPTTFLSLPRELRDQIYRETLSDEPDVYSECAAEQNPGHWFPVRKTSPGFYRPVIHLHKSVGRYHGWEHQTKVADQPALYQVGSEVGREAMNLHLQSRVLLEMTVGDCVDAIDKWQGEIGDSNVQMIRKLHVLVHAHALLKGNNTKLLQGHSFLRSNQLELGGPVFCIEIRDQGAELILLVTAQLKDSHQQCIEKALKAWNKERCLSIKEARLFSGVDAVAVAKLLPECAKAISKFEEFQLHVKEEEIYGVINYACDGRTRSELQLVDGYSYVVAKETASYGKEDAVVRNTDNGQD
jgi:hypothetical protein